MRERRGSGLVLLLAALFLLLGAGIFLLLREPPSEEDRVRQTIGAVATAAREADLTATMEPISPEYRDADGVDYEGLWAFMFQQYRRRGPIAVALSPVEVELGEDGQTATARFSAALADGIDVTSLELMPENADVIGFEVQLALEEGDWRIRGHERDGY